MKLDELIDPKIILDKSIIKLLNCNGLTWDKDDNGEDSWIEDRWNVQILLVP